MNTVCESLHAPRSWVLTFVRMTEKVLLIGAEARLHMVEEGRADEEALLVALKGEAAAVDDQFAALVDAHLDVMLDPLLVGGADDRPVMGIGIGRDADPQPLDRRD